MCRATADPIRPARAEPTDSKFAEPHIGDLPLRRVHHDTLQGYIAAVMWRLIAKAYWTIPIISRGSARQIANVMVAGTYLPLA